VVDVHAAQHTTEGPALATIEPPETSREIVHEPWQFYSMMCLAGLYMAMVLTDWDSADGYATKVTAFGSRNGTNSQHFLPAPLTTSPCG